MAPFNPGSRLRRLGEQYLNMGPKSLLTLAFLQSSSQHPKACGNNFCPGARQGIHLFPQAPTPFHHVGPPPPPNATATQSRNLNLSEPKPSIQTPQAANPAIPKLQAADLIAATMQPLIKYFLQLIRRQGTLPPKRLPITTLHRLTCYGGLNLHPNP